MIYRFGIFELDSSVFELRKSGMPTSVEPQVFNLLRFLIDNRERVVSRDEVIDVVWEGRIVSEATLSSRIFTLRQVLGDTGEAQETIQTVRGRGFRFLADVTTDTETSNSEPAQSQTGTDQTAFVQDVNDSTGRIESVAENSNLSTSLAVLAVLPFKMASDGLDEYFCDGLTEDIISNLTHFRELRVIASGSSLQFKDRTIPLTDVAAKLRAGYLVDGSVRRTGDNLRAVVQLIDASTGVTLWADRYDIKVEGIFAVQDEVTQKIAAALGVKMQTAELTRALAKSPTEFDAYDCLLHARRYTATLSFDMHSEARDLLEKAVRLDPNYADAHALLANVYLAEYRFGANPKPGSIDRALEAALKAVQLDPQNAYAHCWLAIVHYFQRDIGKFDAEMQRALDLNPHDPEILAEAGHYFCFKGEIERGIELSKRAQVLNPLHPGWYHFSPALLSYHQGRYQDMLQDVQRISMPNFFWTHLLNAAALGRMGKEEAGASLSLMHEAQPGVSAATEMKKWIVSQEKFENLMLGLRKAGHDE